MNADQIERFWTKVQKTDSCWNWNGQFSKSGYGKFAVRENGIRRHLRAHRAAWEIATGSAPSLLVCHRCDNPACVRIDHLFLGTAKDNTQDALRKGRLRTGPMPAGAVCRGERSGNARLTEIDVLEIRALAATGLAQSAIAARFGIRQPQVSAIVIGRSWAHIKIGIMPCLSRSDAGRRS